MVFSVFGGRHLLYFHCGIDYTEYQDGGSDIEGINHRVGYYALWSYIADTDPCEDEREQETYEAAGIAQEALDGIGESFLLFVHHVAHHHFERLHCHVDGSVQEHQRYESEYHCRAHCHTKTTGIGQQAHHQYGYQ